MSPAARHRAALRDRLIARLRDHLAVHPPAGADRVILFGSLARGDFDGASDADLLVVGEAGDIDPGIHAAIGRACDIIAWTPAEWADAAGHPLAERIRTEGVEVWCRG